MLFQEFFDLPHRLRLVEGIQGVDSQGTVLRIQRHQPDQGVAVEEFGIDIFHRSGYGEVEPAVFIDPI